MDAYKPRRQGIATPKPTISEWRRILRRCRHRDTGHPSDCWIWLGRIDLDGYGEVKYRNAKRFVHRVAYAARHGETPARRDIEHLCKQHACCNPDHIIALRPKENAAGRSDKGQMPLQFNRGNFFDKLPF